MVQEKEHRFWNQMGLDQFCSICMILGKLLIIYGYELYNLQNGQCQLHVEKINRAGIKKAARNWWAMESICYHFLGENPDSPLGSIFSNWGLWFIIPRSHSSFCLVSILYIPTFS